MNLYTTVAAQFPTRPGIGYQTKRRAHQRDDAAPLQKAVPDGTLAATLDDGSRVSAEAFRRIAGDCGLVVFD